MGLISRLSFDFDVCAVCKVCRLMKGGQLNYPEPIPTRSIFRFHRFGFDDAAKRWARFTAHPKPFMTKLREGKIKESRLAQIISGRLCKYGRVSGVAASARGSGLNEPRHRGGQ